MFLIAGYYREHQIIGNPKYRSDFKRQRERFNKFLDVVREVTLKEWKEVHLLGDFSPWHLQPLVDDLHQKVINGAGYVQTVSELTRWSGKITRILDLHFTNRPDRTGGVKITRNFRTDHAVMTLTRKQFDFPGPPAIYKRCWKPGGQQRYWRVSGACRISIHYLCNENKCQYQ